MRASPRPRAASLSPDRWLEGPRAADPAADPSLQRLKAYHVADIKGATVSDYVAGHREIRQKLLERGMFETRMSYYYTKAACFVALAATFTACVTQSS